VQAGLAGDARVEAREPRERTIWARIRSRCSVLWPSAVFFNRARSEAVRLIGRAGGAGLHGGRAGQQKRERGRL
jgi:hypothetical protein